MANNIPPVNHVEMDRQKLVNVLEYFGYRIGEHFSHSIRLVVHGGACMLLHPGLHNLAKQQAEMTPEMKIRRTTRDVDYIHRSFVQEWTTYGEPDAPTKLQTCIRETAAKFGLGADWMNSAADVALPMATDPRGRQYDPIFTASIQPENTRLHTIFSSANGMLDLVSVAPFWAVALKLVRYAKWDASDICLLLKYGLVLSPGTHWSTEYLERWLMHHCWTMGYNTLHPQRKIELRQRIKHAITMVNEWYTKTPTLEEFLPTGFRTDYDRPSGSSEANAQYPSRRAHVSRESVMGTKGLDRDQAAWGGDDRSGWQASFAGDWVKPNGSPPQPTHPATHTHSHSLPEQTQQYEQHGHERSQQQQQPPFALSPLLLQQNQSLANLDLMPPRPKEGSNVADWIAEDERKREKRERRRERRRERERQQERERERVKEGEVVEPFIPPLYAVDNEASPRGRGGDQQSAHQRRAQSQPPIPPEPHRMTHHASLQAVTSLQNLQSKNPGLLNSIATPTNAYPITYSTQQFNPQHPWSAYYYYYHLTPPNGSTKAERKERGKRRDKARDKARSAKKTRQDYTIAPDGSYIVNLWQNSPKGGDSREHQNYTSSQPPSPPIIYPLTDVVYYNQVQPHPQNVGAHTHTSPPQPPVLPQQHAQNSPPYPPLQPPMQTSPPYRPPPQTYAQPVTSMVQPWSHAMNSAQVPPHMPLTACQAPPHILAPMRTSSQPVIPPDEYICGDERPAGKLQKLMNALKIS